VVQRRSEASSLPLEPISPGILVAVVYVCRVVGMVGTVVTIFVLREFVATAFGVLAIPATVADVVVVGRRPTLYAVVTLEEVSGPLHSWHISRTWEWKALCLLKTSNRDEKIGDFCIAAIPSSV
jgi:hypothetical protein